MDRLHLPISWGPNARPGTGGQPCWLLLHEGFNETFPFLQDLCAGLLGASRPAVNQVLKDLEARSLIRLSYGRIHVLEKTLVVQLADSASARRG